MGRKYKRRSRDLHAFLICFQYRNLVLSPSSYPYFPRLFPFSSSVSLFSLVNTSIILSLMSIPCTALLKNLHGTFGGTVQHGLHNTSGCSLVQTMDSQSLSDELFHFVTGPDSAAERSRQDDANAKRQRLGLITDIRSTLTRGGGDCLVSDHDEDSFSYHGSLYKRTHPRLLNDIDIYVVLNGDGLFWDQETSSVTSRTGSRSRHENLHHPYHSSWSDRFASKSDPVTSRSTLPLVARDDGTGCVNVPFNTSRHRNNNVDPREAIRWLHSVVHEVFSDCSMPWIREHITESSRGVKIISVGTPSRNFDVIPAFLLRRESYRFHIIPQLEGNVVRWSLVATDFEKMKVSSSDRLFPSIPEAKVLGYRQLLKLMKFIARHRDNRWLEKSGISSFVLEWTVLNEMRLSDSANNYDRIEKIVEYLNYVIRYGCYRDASRDGFPLEFLSPTEELTSNGSHNPHATIMRSLLRIFGPPDYIIPRDLPPVPQFIQLSPGWLWQNCCI